MQTHYREGPTLYVDDYSRRLGVGIEPTSTLHVNGDVHIAGGITVDEGNPGDRQSKIALGSGLVAETFPLSCCTGSQIMTTQDCRSTLIYMYGGEVATNWLGHCTVNAAAITTAKGGLFLASDGSQKAVTANTTGAVLTAGAGTIASIPFVASYTIPANDWYYLSFFCQATTPPTWARGHFATGAGNAIGSGYARACNTSTLSDIPTTLTKTAAGLFFWFAVS